MSVIRDISSHISQSKGDSAQKSGGRAEAMNSATPESPGITRQAGEMEVGALVLYNGAH